MASCQNLRDEIVRYFPSRNRSVPSDTMDIQNFPNDITPQIQNIMATRSCSELVSMDFEVPPTHAQQQSAGEFNIFYNMNVLQPESTSSINDHEPTLREIERDVATLSATNFHLAPTPPFHSYGPLNAAEFEICGYIHDYLIINGFNSPSPHLLEQFTRAYLSGTDIDDIIRQYGTQLTRRE